MNLRVTLLTAAGLLAASSAHAEMPCEDVAFLLESGIAPSVVHFLVDETGSHASLSCLEAPLVNAVAFYDSNAYDKDMDAGLLSALEPFVCEPGLCSSAEALDLIGEVQAEESIGMPGILTVLLWPTVYGESDQIEDCYQEWKQSQFMCIIDEQSVDYVYVATEPRPCQEQTRCGSPSVSDLEEPAETIGQ